MPKQKLLVLYAANSNLTSAVVGWSLYDGTGEFEHEATGDATPPIETTVEMGGTLIVPGSHLRRVHERDIMRYQNIVGQEQIVCPAGTVVFWHNNLWHSARSNRSHRRRMMFKVRLGPRVPQHQTWDVSDIDDPEVFRILDRPEGWHGVGEGVLEPAHSRGAFGGSCSSSRGPLP